VSDQPEDAKAGRLRTEDAAEDEVELEEGQPGAAEHDELIEAATQEMPVVAPVAETPLAPPRVRKIDFVSRRNWYFLFSLLIIIPGIFFMVQSGFRLGIDFAGGTEFTVNFANRPTQAQVENAVTADIAGGSVISTGNGGYIIRTPPLTPAQQKTFEDQLRTGLGTYDLQQVLEVGGTIAAETIELALLSVVLAAAASLSC
jgi:preprotein translocase subunit SecF